jgi:hypothetical protein
LRFVWLVRELPLSSPYSNRHICMNLYVLSIEHLVLRGVSFVGSWCTMGWIDMADGSWIDMTEQFNYLYFSPCWYYVVTW